MNVLGKYSNGWGHVIVTISSLVFCSVLLLVSRDGSVQSLAITIATLLIGYWFGSGKSSQNLIPDTPKGDTAEEKEGQK